MQLFFTLTFCNNTTPSIFQRDVVSSHLDGGGSVGEEGVEDAFELLHEINERIRTGLWVGDCFIYNNSSSRLNYCVGGEVSLLSYEKSLLCIVSVRSFITSCSCSCTSSTHNHSMYYRSQPCFTWTDRCTY